MRILVVDDQEDLRSLLRVLLEREGHEVIEASHGRMALAMVEVDPEIGLVILDVQMPDMTGWEVLRSLRFIQNRYIAVLMCTVKAGPGDFTTAERLDVDGYIPKPFDPSDVRDAVAEIIRRDPWSEHLGPPRIREDR
jgi:CheY-like chemotaxis protein